MTTTGRDTKKLLLSSHLRGKYLKHFLWARTCKYLFPLSFYLLDKVMCLLSLSRSRRLVLRSSLPLSCVIKLSKPIIVSSFSCVHVRRNPRLKKNHSINTSPFSESTERQKGKSGKESKRERHFRPLSPSLSSSGKKPGNQSCFVSLSPFRPFETLSLFPFP